MSLVRILALAGPRIGAVVKATPEVLARIGKRLGIAATNVTPQLIIDQAKGNKLMTAMVLYEMYGLGDEVLQSLMSKDADVKTAVTLFSFKTDDKSDEVDSGPEPTQDELDMLSTAVRQVGSFEKLLTLKHAMSMSTNTYRKYLEKRTTGRALA